MTRITREAILVLSLLILLSLVGCGERDAPAAQVAAAPAAQPQLTAADAVAARAGIEADDLMGHIATLASDEFGGRAPMSEGERLTLDYLEKGFRTLGLEPMFGDSYRQPVPLVSIEASRDTALTVSGPDGQQHYAYGPQAMYWSPREAEDTGLENSELVWVGYGIVAPEYGWNDYAGLDVTGKTVVILVNDPGYATQDPEVFNGNSMTYYGRWTYKYEEARRQGAEGAIIIHQTEPAAYGWNVVRDSWSGPQFHLAAKDRNMGGLKLEGWIQHEVAEEIFTRAGLNLDAMTAAAAKGPVTPAPLGLKASAPLHNKLQYAESYNVGAVLPGSERPRELFIYMAHWDHLGTEAHDPGQEGDFIFNGAEDNASGVAGLLELAKAFASLPEHPARTVGFLSVTAEESGLLGSKAYVADPAWPMNETVAGINMDRLNFRGTMSDVMVIGYGASQMEDILADAARPYGRTITPEATPEKGYYYRSDHFNFAKRGVPILYARGGTVDRVHGADYVSKRDAEYVANRYHSPRDEIQPDWVVGGAVEDLQLFFDIGLRLANDDEWPEWYKGNEFRAIREASMAKARSAADGTQN